MTPQDRNEYIKDNITVFVLEAWREQASVTKSVDNIVTFIAEHIQRERNLFDDREIPTDSIISDFKPPVIN
jgi:hypothetical protein